MTRSRRRPANDFLPLRPQELQILMILARSPLHAYGIARTSEEAEGGVRLEVGSLYRMLNRMLTAGLISEATDADPNAGPAGMRRSYRITPLGSEVLEAEAHRLEAVLEAARRQRILPEENA